MRQVYLNLYDFVWLCIAKHCSNLFSHANSLNYSSGAETSANWLEEIGSLVLDELDKCKEQKCFKKLFQTYFFALNSKQSMHNEEKLRQASKSYPFMSKRINLGKYLLATLLLVNTLLGLWVTYTFQAVSGDFSLTAILLAAVTYLGVAWCVFEARATLFFKLTLLTLIALSCLNSVLWSLWKNITNAQTCYSEVCALLMPSSLFQNIEIKLPMLIFWIIFLLVISLKTPISDYLIYKKSTNRYL